MRAQPNEDLPQELGEKVPKSLRQIIMRASLSSLFCTVNVIEHLFVYEIR